MHAKFGKREKANREDIRTYSSPLMEEIISFGDQPIQVVLTVKIKNVEDLVPMSGKSIEGDGLRKLKSLPQG